MLLLADANGVSLFLTNLPLFCLSAISLPVCVCVCVFGLPAAWETAQKQQGAVASPCWSWRPLLCSIAFSFLFSLSASLFVLHCIKHCVSWLTQIFNAVLSYPWVMALLKQNNIWIKCASKPKYKDWMNVCLMHSCYNTIPFGLIGAHSCCDIIAESRFSSSGQKERGWSVRREHTTRQTALQSGLRLCQQPGQNQDSDR